MVAGVRFPHRACRTHTNPGGRTMSREDTPSAWPVYRVIRFRKNGKRRTIKTHLTEAEAQEHCSRDDTSGPDWFDSYDFMKEFRPKVEKVAQ